MVLGGGGSGGIEEVMYFSGGILTVNIVYLPRGSYEDGTRR